MKKSIEKKGIYSGLIEKDAKGNYFCGEILLDYKTVEDNFKLGDKITIKSIIENRSRISSIDYPNKTKNFSIFNLKS